MCNEFLFNHTLEAANSSDRRRRECVKAVAQQEALVDFYIPAPAVEVKLLTRVAAQKRYYVLQNSFMTNLLFQKRLDVRQCPVLSLCI